MPTTTAGSQIPRILGSAVILLVGSPAAACEFPEVSELPVQRGMVSPLHRIGDAPVADPDHWPEQREYLKTLLAHYLYGTMPPKPEAVDWARQNTRPAVEGKAVIGNYHVTFQRQGKSAVVRAAVLRPDRPGRFPVIIKNDRFLFGADQLTGSETETRNPKS